MKKTIIHVNQHLIKSNNKKLRNQDLSPVTLDPPLTIKSYNTNNYANRADIIVDGKVAASVIHSPTKPLSCGARVWIETFEEVKTTI